MEGQRESEGKGGGFIAAGALYGLLGVAFGAFTAHMLRGHVAPQALAWLSTASLYWLVHGLALVGVGLMSRGGGGRLLALSGWGFGAGALLFAGSLTAVALGAPRSLLWAAPLGGSLLLAAWAALLAVGLMQWRRSAA